MFLEGLQISKYRLQRLVGQGAAGMVYLADDLRLPRQVALKIVQGDDASVESLAETRRLFQREAKAIAHLNHPNILPLFDFGEEIIQGVTVAYLVTPFCPNGSLVKWFQTHNTWSLSDVIALIQQAASALAYAHEHGIVHRDVKPSNFLVRVHNTMPNRPDLLLADFGIARFTNATVNASKTIRGTPTYMAPEQWSGDPVAASDQYSLAVMAYELLTGRPPFTGTQNQIMYHHLITYPQPPSMVNPQLSPALDGVLLRALAKQPEARYPTVTEFASALQQVELHTPDVVSQPPRVITPQVIAPVAVRDTPNISPMPPTADELEETQASLMQHARTTDIPIIEPLPHLPPARINWKMLSLIGLVAMLVIASFIGFSSFNSGRSANGDATAVQALQNMHATATAQANIQATSTAQAATTAAVTSNPYDSDFNKLVFYDQLTGNTDNIGTKQARVVALPLMAIMCSVAPKRYSHVYIMTPILMI